MTIITIPISETQPVHPHIRRFDIRRDLNMVADLVELCFADSLDADGRRYIRQMRSTARHPNFLRWTAGIAERAAIPFNGYVWVLDGHVIGNLSLIPMRSKEGKVFLIANVAVHPDHRRQGIAGYLTETAIADCLRSEAAAVWLHVRADNVGAVALYQGMGFIERERRTNWRAISSEILVAPSEDISILPRKSTHWSQQEAWLKQLHPQRLDWYLPLKLNKLRPGLVGMFHRAMSGDLIKQWSAVQDGTLHGVAAWVKGHTHNERIWLAADPNDPELSAGILAIIYHLANEIPPERMINIEYPADLGAEAFQSAGFKPRQTLIWMKYG